MTVHYLTAAQQRTGRRALLAGPFPTYEEAAQHERAARGFVAHTRWVDVPGDPALNGVTVGIVSARARRATPPRARFHREITGT